MIEIVEPSRVTESGFEKRGGYAAPEIDITNLPKVSPGPGQGASPDTNNPGGGSGTTSGNK